MRRLMRYKNSETVNLREAWVECFPWGIHVSAVGLYVDIPAWEITSSYQHGIFVKKTIIIQGRLVHEIRSLLPGIQHDSSRDLLAWLKWYFQNVPPRWS